jgi:hypothetical protein
MGDVIRMPQRPRVVERFQEIIAYAEFGPLRITMAKSDTDSSSLALILDGLGPEIGFEVLGRFSDDDHGRSTCDAMAKAVSLALLHLENND